jgi:Cullin binding
MAIEYWKLLLKDHWAYLDLWIEFLRDKYSKTIPKDTWNLLYDFIQDIGVNFDKYDENGILSTTLSDNRCMASNYR